MQELVVGLKLVESDITFLFAEAVAFVAVLDEDWLDLLVKIERRVGGNRRARADEKAKLARTRTPAGPR